jgi:hypothetical protein
VPLLNRDDSVLYFPPEAFDPFRVLHQIGAGTLGPVFRAHEPDRDRLVAIKVFRLDLNPEQTGLLAQALQDLVKAGPIHPSIAAPIGAGVEGGSVYLAQEYAVGDSLDVVLREHGRVSLADAFSVVDQLADAIDTAAAGGLHHGLLHPRDVLLGADGPVVTGFGIAQALTGAGARLPVRRPYSAPERVQGTDWGSTADVFALAAMTYELVVGRRLAGTSDQAADFLVGVEGLGGATLVEVFAAALAADPEARYKGARAFAAGLRGAARLDASAGVPDSLLLRDEMETESDREHGEAALEPVTVAALIPDDAPASQAPDRPLDDAAMADFRIDVDPGDGDERADAPLPPAWEGPEPARVLPSDAPVNGRFKTAMVPAALALVVGLLAGFLGGYSIGSRTGGSREPGPAPAASVAAAPVAAEAPKMPAPERTVPPAAPAPRPAAPTGRLLVRSTPAGAQVAVNGEPRGQTPLTLREMPLGSYTIRLTRDGYAGQEHRLQLTPARASASLVVLLRRAPVAARSGSSHGSLYVESRPPGARVFLHNRLVGTTPLAVSDLAAGSVDVRIEQEGYQPWTSDVRITASERSRVTASLDRREAK